MTIVYPAAVKRAAMFLALCGLCAGLAGRGAAAILEFPIPSIVALPRGITCGPDGAYWFVEYNEGRVGRVDTNGLMTEYIIPSKNPAPYGIVTGPDGNLWFTENQLSQIGRISTNGVVQEFPLPFNVLGTGITVGPDGRLWLLDYGPANMVGSTNGGIVAVTLSNSIPAGFSYYNSNLTFHSRPLGITTGLDGNLYFTEAYAGKIGRITTSGVITEAPITPTNTQPITIVTGPDGALWFTQATTNALGRIDTSNFTNVMQFSLPTNNSGGLIIDELNGLVLGRDGNLYYTDLTAGILGQVGVSGTNITVTQFYTPTTNAQPWMLATGPDSNIWFGEYAGNAIAKFLLPVPLSFQITSNQIVLSWTTNVGTSFKLQENSGFNLTNWVTVTNVPVVNTNTGKFVVTISPTNGPPTNSVFFRLID